MFKKMVYDLPFDEDSASQFLPWVIALTTFMTTIFILSALTLSSFIDRWSQEMFNQITVQIPTLNRSVQEQDRLTRGVFHQLKMNQAIADIKTVPAEQTHKWLEPWFGQNFHQLELPVPIMMTVVVKPGHSISSQDVLNDLLKIVPDVSLVYHQEWHKQLLDIIKAVRIVVHTLVALLSCAAIGSLIFTVSAGLVIHKNIIHILRLVGARSGYIARQFQNHTLKMGLKGVAYHFLALLCLVFFFRFFCQGFGVAMLTEILPLTLGLGVLFFVPLCVVVVMVLAARITVSFALRRYV